MARSFNGTSDYISGTIPSSAGNSLTIAAWLFRTGGTVAALVAEAVNSGSPTTRYAQILFRNDSSDIGQAAYYYDGNYQHPGSGTLSSNVWVPIVGTFSSTGITIYVPGFNSFESATLASSAFNQFSIGGAPGGGCFQGSIADVSMWNVVLSAGEIAAYMAGGRPAQIRPASLIGWWPLDGLQSPEPDLSGNKNNGTLTGTAYVPGPPVNLFTRKRANWLEVASSGTNVNLVAVAATGAAEAFSAPTVSPATLTAATATGTADTFSATTVSPATLTAATAIGTAEAFGPEVDVAPVAVAITGAVEGFSFANETDVTLVAVSATAAAVAFGVTVAAGFGAVSGTGAVAGAGASLLVSLLAAAAYGFAAAFTNFAPLFTRTAGFPTPHILRMLKPWRWFIQKIRAV